MAHDRKVMGSNPSTIYWMDVSDLLAITLREKFKIKVAKWGTPKKSMFILTICSSGKIHKTVDMLSVDWVMNSLLNIK